MRNLTTACCLFLSFSAMAQIKPTSAEERMKGLQQRKQLSSSSLINNTSFRSIGPTVMSGRVVDMDVNPDNPSEFYVAYATGGLWHTVNNGQSFKSIFDSEDIMTIGDIAVNWKTRSIWVGTGEVNSSRSSYAGIGVFRSDDNGKTWAYLGLPDSHHIGEIKLHPTDPNIAWVAVLGHLYSSNKDRGMYKTSDGGKTWKQTLAIDANTGAVDVDLNPNNPNELYAAMWYRTRTSANFEEGGKTSGIYKSTNGGDSWQLITKEGSGFPSGEGVGRIGLTVYPANPQTIFAVVDNNFRQPANATQAANTDTSRYTVNDFKGLSKEQFLALNDKKMDAFIGSPRNGIPRKYTAASLKQAVTDGKFPPTCIWDFLNDPNAPAPEAPIYGAQLYRSDDGGATWKMTNTRPLPGLYSTYGYYFGKVWVSPVNDKKVILSGVSLMMSTDGGQTFKNIDKENVHSDHHYVWVNPKKDSHIINGNDGGCNITYDDGEHWFKANTPAVGQFYNITVDMARPYNVYGGLQDNGTWYGSSTSRIDYDWYDSGHNPYTSIGGGDGMQVQVDWRDNKTVYSGSQFGAYNRQTVGTRERRSVRPTRDLGESALRFNWQSPILLSRHNQDVFYFGTNKLHMSLNRGDSMITMSPDLTTNPKQGDVPFGTLTTISESPLKFGLLYVGSDDGNIHVSRDGGNSWTNINKKLPKGLYISRVTASAFSESRVYATLNGYRNDHFTAYVYVSDDYGNNWRQVMTDLPAEPVNVIKEDATNENILYVGTDGGLYISIDGGASSMMWNKGIPYSIPVHDIAIQSRDNEIVVGTHGRSIYIAKLEEVQKLAKDATYREKRKTEVSTAK